MRASLRRRASSLSGKSGRSATSAISGSASSRRATGTRRRTVEASHDGARRRARRRGSRPRRRARARPCPPRPRRACPRSWGRGPRGPRGRRSRPARTTRSTSTTGTSCIGDEQDGEAVREREPLDGGQHRAGARARASAGRCGRPGRGAAPAASGRRARAREDERRPGGRSSRHLRHREVLLPLGHHRDEHPSRRRGSARPRPARRSGASAR